MLNRLAPIAVFSGAALVFLVQPLIGRLLLPSLGGAPAVWNTSLVFFQAALLAGYAYAHALQRLGPIRRQAAVHVGVLLLAALVLPLRISEAWGAPDVERPAAWLLGALLLSVGAPFAALSATAPLVQAWWATAWGGARDPYPLYAASNLGSLLALLSYPLLVEPALGLQLQAGVWSVGYLLFAAAMTALAASLPRGVTSAPPSVEREAGGRTWRRRAWWALLGAIPSSLLLGVTAHISTDVASAPFLWVVPLALYLLTFVVAFQTRPLIPVRYALIAQAVAAPAALAAAPFTGEWALLLPVHMAAFFLTSLVCHQRLAASRPEPARLTEFYLALAVGGVLGGAFNALLAPSLFDLVWEYPLALVLASVARPFGRGRPGAVQLGVLAGGLLAAALAVTEPITGEPSLVARLALGAVASAAFLLRDRALLFGVMLALLAVAAGRVGTTFNAVETERSFFGVHRVALNSVSRLGAVRFLMNGTTLHGAQSAEPGQACRPLTYYAPGTPLGQSLTAVQARGPARVGVVGLGAGSMAARIRPGDSVRFFEIDPVVARLAQTSFSYLGACAPGRSDLVLGDARLTVGREPAGRYDLLLIDAFSSDAVPTHLLTAEAMQVWLRALKPDGLLVLHLSNRNLELEGPAAAALRAAGLEPLTQFRSGPRDAPPLSDMTAQAIAASRSPTTLARLRAQGRWRPARDGVAAWTDDRTDVLGALILKAAR